MSNPVGITLSLEGAQQVEQGLRRVSGSLESVGVSARQTAAAMRQVPAQFTDIVVSLQGGQAPLTVLLQQGGQLKDMFGGVGNAAKALGGYVLGLVTPLNVLGASVATVGYAMYAGAEQQRAWRQALILSGNAAGATAGQIEQVFAATAKATGKYGDSEDAIIALVKSRQVSVDQLGSIAASIVKYSKAAGVEVKTLAEDFASIGKDPIKALTQLGEKYGTLTAATYQQVNALMEQGKRQEAVTLASQRTTEAMDAITAKAKENKGYLEQFWAAASGAVGGMWQGTKDWGKNETPEGELKKLEAQLAQRRQIAANLGTSEADERGNAKILAQIAYWKQLVDANQEAAKAEGELREANQRGVAGMERLNAAYTQHMGKQEQLIKQLRELKQARDDALKAPDTDADAVNKRYQVSVEAAKRQAAPSFDMPSLVHSLLTQESGNRQFRDDGTVVRNATSGATGIAQIMPQYGADYARMAGVEWSPQLLESSAEYGKKLAEAGIKTYLKMFDGDLEKALSAYNAGPGTVKKAVDSAGPDGDWRTEMRKYQSAGNYAQTKDYREKILGRMPQDWQGNYGDSLGAAPSSAFEKSLIEAREKLAKVTAEATGAQQQLAQSQKDLAALQASPVWATYNEQEQATLRTLYEKSAVQEKIKASAEDGAKIRAMANEQAAANEVFGKTKTAVEAWKLEQKQANLEVAQATKQAPELIEQLKATAAEQERYVNLLREADYKAMMANADELLRNARATADVYRDEANLMGLSAIERAKVLAMRQVELRYAKEIAAVEKSNLSRSQKDSAISTLEQAKLIDSQAAVAKVVLDEWTRTSEQINSTLTDALMRGFESGKDFAKNLRDSMVNMFKTLVLRPIVSAIVQPVSMVVNGVGQAGMQAVGMGGGSALSTVGNAASIASGVGAMGGAFAGGMGWLTGATTFSGAMSAGGSLVAAGGAGIAPGLGMMAGALAPIVLGLAALTALVNKFDKSGTPHYGAASIYEGGASKGGDDVFKTSGTSGRYAAAAQAGVDLVAKGVGDTLEGMSKTFKLKGGYSVMAGYSDDSSDDPGFGSFRITQGGTKLKDWEDTRTSKWGAKIFADGEEGWKMYLAAIAKDTKQVLVDMGLPSWAKGMLEQVDDASGMEGLSKALAQIAQVQVLFEDLGNTLVGFAGMVDTAQGALLKAAGGAEALAKSTSAYYQNFYSDDERKAIAKRQLGDKLKELGIEGFDFEAQDAREKYRQLVEEKLAQANAAGQSLSPLQQAKDAREKAAKDAADKAKKATTAQSGLLGGQDVSALSGLDPEASGDKKKPLALPSPLEAATRAAQEGQLKVLKDQQEQAAKSAAALLGLSEAIAGVTTSSQEAEQKLQEAKKAAQSDAYELFKRAVARDKAQLQAPMAELGKTISSIGSAVASVRSSAKELYGQVDASKAMFAAQGMVYIEDALQGVRGGQQLSGYDGLTDAITAAKGGISAGAYVSQFERERDTLVLAGQLTELGDLGEVQKSVQERQLKALQEQLDYLDRLAQRADDLVNGTAALTGTVQEYFDKLLALLAPEGQGEAKPGGAGAGGQSLASGVQGVATAPWAFGQGYLSTPEKFQEEANYGFGRFGLEVQDAARNAKLAALRTMLQSEYGSGQAENLTRIADKAKGMGAGIGDIASALGFWSADIEAEFARAGIPAFDVGTNYVPRDMLAQIHEGEAIIPKAFNPWADARPPGGAGVGSDALVAEIRALREEISQLKAISAATASNTSTLAQMVDQFDSVTEGGNVMRSDAAGVLEI